MKKFLFTIAAVAAGLQLLCVPCSAQYITGALPEEDRVRSVEIVEVKRKVRQAKDIIEKKGLDSLRERKKRDPDWAAGEYPLFVVEATPGAETEGVFIIYPEVKKIGRGALDMKKVNGRHFARQTRKDATGGKKSIWYGFIATDTAKFPHAKTLARSAEGRHYAIASTSMGLAQEKHFLTALVNTACELVALEGEKAFPALADKDSAFRLNDSYVYVIDIDGTMLLDPNHPEYAGRKIDDYPSIYPGYQYPTFSSTLEGALELAESGKYPRNAREYRKALKDVLIANGQAWTAYYITKPGEEHLYRKVSYDKVVKGPRGRQYVVGSGVNVYVSEL